MMRRLPQALALFLLIFSNACKKSETSSPQSSSALARLLVSSTDPDIQFHADAEHLYYDCAPSCSDDQILLVFFPGSDGSPDNFQKLIQSIGNTGVRAIALAYQNNGALSSICGTDDACYTNARRDRVLGAAGSTYVQSAADGIQNRLLKALKALGWNQFHDGDTLLYSKMIFSGFSQGAGMAAWAAKKVQLQRVCLFAGPWDHLTGTTPASWIQEASATPSDRYYGFTHYDDSLPGGVQYLNLNWQQLGMGTGTDIPLYSNPSGQKLTSKDSDARCVADPHGCSVSDAATPLESDGTPRYQTAWRYLCGR
ncbi:MAG TPA: hypothetical protein VFO10_11975 [Oligoflexus sp.]|uniref:BPSS1187 family protein n=1 Tax=Oligoflexus sp. TaxID=1971216 RepID=UPI002D7F3300|nr:hypothetical protein [Oligoflexus sp.]HET9237966.1 hypothetical protein [Oligoflexus sp.]